MKPILPILALVVAVVAGGAWYLSQGDDKSAMVPEMTSTSSETPAEEVTQSDTGSAADTAAVAPAVEMAPDMAMGDANAPVTLIEYASYTCPHCGDFHDRVFDKLKAEYIDTGKVRFVHREVYFDRFGLWGGLLARCGGEMRYFGIVDVLYATQKEWIGKGENDEVLTNLSKIGKTAGLDQDTIDACLKDEAMAQSMVTAYQTHAEADDITGTPSLVINGEKYGNMTYDDLKKVIDGLL